MDENFNPQNTKVHLTDSEAHMIKPFWTFTPIFDQTFADIVLEFPLGLSFVQAFVKIVLASPLGRSFLVVIV